MSAPRFPRAYVEGVRESLRAQVAAYDQLVSVVGADGSDPASDAALEAIEPVVFNNLLIALEAAFTDADADVPVVSEVRTLARALVSRRGVFSADSGAPPSVLGYKDGDRVALDKEDFVRIAEAFLAAIDAS